MVEVQKRPVGAVATRGEITGDDVPYLSEDNAYSLFIRKELEVALVEAADPTTKWLSEEEFWDGLD